MELVVKPLGMSLAASAGANLLETLRGHGVPISYSCMAGRCGTCRCKLIAGNVIESLSGGTTSQAKPEQDILACRSAIHGDSVIEVPEPDEVITHPARVLRATVSDIADMTHDIKRLRLKATKPLAFSPGQYALLQFAPDLVRPYSMAGLSTDDELEFHIRLVPQGRSSEHVARHLKPGDAVRVSGPMGTAYLRLKHEGPMLCIAGGTGLAPVLSIVRGALDAGMKQAIHLYFGVRSAQDVYALDQLQALAREHEQIRLTVAVAQGPAPAPFRSGMVTEVLEQDLPDLQGWRAYLCGAPPMVEAASTLAQRLGIPGAHIHADAFYASGE